MMKILEAEAREMIARERWRANIQHEPFRSTHEGFAVLAEECQELGEAVEAIARELERMWKCIREDDDKGAYYQAGEIYDAAKAAVAEAAQVGAMADKCIDFYEAQKRHAQQEELDDKLSELKRKIEEHDKEAWNE